MKAEVISIGTELTQGFTTNTNSSFLARELFEIGIELEYITTVPDNLKVIHSALKVATNRVGIIITTGGLGPTHDDLTHYAISSYFKKKLFLDKNILNQIKRKFILRGYKNMPKINIKQALKPKGAKWISNKYGTANGMLWKINKKIILTFPGVPSELEQMWEGFVKEKSKAIFKKKILYSKTLLFTGIGESALAEKIKPYFNLSNPIVAPYASLGEVKIRVTSKARSKKQAEKMANKVINKILKKTRQYYFGSDNDTLEKLVSDLLVKRNKTIAIAESCTGGLLSKRVTDIPGSSQYIGLNLVTYSNESKNKSLKVPKDTLKKYGAVSSQTAALMAVGVKELAKTDIGISITGIAGPSGGTKSKPVGLIYFGLCFGKKIETKKVFFGSNLKRSQIRFLATQYALNWLRQELLTVIASRMK